jgi:hypothetical protein
MLQMKWRFYLGGMEIVVDEESELNTCHSLSFREYSMDVYKSDDCEVKKKIFWLRQIFQHFFFLN